MSSNLVARSGLPFRKKALLRAKKYDIPMWVPFKVERLKEFRHWPAASAADHLCRLGWNPEISTMGRSEVLQPLFGHWRSM